MKDALNLDAELIRSSGGIFDVAVDGRVVYSKRQTGRFPRPGEVPAAITALTGNA